MSSLSTFFSISWSDRLLFAEAIVLSCVTRIAILIFPFRRLACWLGECVEDSRTQIGIGSDIQLLKRVRWAVEAAGRRVPWKCKCLGQAMMAKSMLCRRGVCGEVLFGLTNGETDLEGHAWLRCGETVVTGRVGLHKYVTLSRFAFGRIDSQNITEDFRERAQTA